MPQAYRTPPRQMGFKPSVRRLVASNPARTPASETDLSERTYTTQLQQLYTRKENLSLQLDQVQSQVLIHRLQAQIQPLQLEIQTIEQALSALRMSVRMEALSKLADPTAEEHALQSQFASLAQIYQRQAPLLKQQRPVLEAWLSAVDSVLVACQHQHLPAELLAVSEAQFQVLLLELLALEQDLLQTTWLKYLTIWRRFVVTEPIPLDSNLAGLSANASEPDGLASFSFAQEPELRFDFAARNALLNTQSAVSLNAPQKSYADYVELGFAAIDQSLATAFQDRDALSQAVSYFLVAIDLDQAAYEAYFGLGYLYALVQDLNHALYFLGLAHQISSDPGIAQLICELKQTAGLSRPAV